jgi:hypothetical protein
MSKRPSVTGSKFCILLIDPQTNMTCNIEFSTVHLQASLYYPHPVFGDLSMACYGYRA